MTARSYEFKIELPTGSDTSLEVLRELALDVWLAAFRATEPAEPLVVRDGDGPSFLAIGSGRSVVGHVAPERSCISFAIFSWGDFDRQGAEQAACRILNKEGVLP